MKPSVFLICAFVTGSVLFGLGRVTPVVLTEHSKNPSVAAGSPAGAIPDPDTVTLDLPSETGKWRPVKVAKYEVSFGEWQTCVDAGGCTYIPRRRSYVTDEHPVTGVSWLDVQSYIAWFSAETGKAYRLPLESEWRAFASHVLDVEVKKLFDDPRMAWAADYANFSKRAERRTRSQGYYGTEANGVADVAGNVWEWTQTCKRNLDHEFDVEPTENCGGARVLAGTHMTYQSELIRSVPTGGCSIGFPPANIGFRLVRTSDTDVAENDRWFAIAAWWRAI